MEDVTVLWSTNPIHEGMSYEEAREHVRSLGDLLKEHLGNDHILIRIWIKDTISMTLRKVDYQDSSLELAKDFLPTLDSQITFYFDGRDYRLNHRPFDEYYSEENWIVQGAPNIEEKMQEIEALLTENNLTYLDVQREMSERIDKDILKWIRQTVSEEDGVRKIKLTADYLVHNGEVLLLVDSKGKVKDMEYDISWLSHYYNHHVLTYS